MPRPLAFPWKPALRLGAGLLVMALTTPEGHSVARPCDPSKDRLPPPGISAGPDRSCAPTR